MERFDFDCPVERRHTGCIKYDGLARIFGRADLTPLWVADMDFAVHPAILESLQRQMECPVLGYPEISESYYNSILKWLDTRHGFNVERNEITYIPGVVKGIALSVLHFTREGDGVVIQPPVYPPFRRVVEGNGRKCLLNPLKLNGLTGQYEMDFDNLRHIIDSEHPRMLILCNPHNPGGRQWSADELRELTSICRQGGVTVVSDEIHGDLLLHGRPHIPFASVSEDAAEISVTLGAPSKTFNIPGLVSSWTVVKNPALREPFFRWLEDNEFSTPTILAAVGTEAAYTKAEEWLNQVLGYIEGNIDMAVEYLREALPGVRPMVPEASFLIWIDCRELGYSAEEISRRLIERGHLALNPGESFGDEGAGFVRLNVATQRASLREALQRLVDSLA